MQIYSRWSEQVKSAFIWWQLKNICWICENECRFRKPWAGSQVQTTKDLPVVCPKKNLKLKLNECHLLFSCDQLRVTFRKYGIITSNPSIQTSMIWNCIEYRRFWSSDMPNENRLEHVNIADSLRYIYIIAMKQLLRQ